MDVTAIGLDEFARTVGAFPKASRQAARMAINDATRYGRREAAKEMLSQVAWPRNYLGNEKNGRLRISQYATDGKLEARITGRFRPTSLARFVTNRTQMLARNRRGPARVTVSPGSTQVIDRAFLLRLRRGTALDEGAHNLGLAIRLKPGEKIRNKKKTVPVSKGVYLLYGPSVNQVFRTVKDDVAPRVEERVAREFSRQFQRLSNV